MCKRTDYLDPPYPILSPLDFQRVTLTLLSLFLSEMATVVDSFAPPPTHLPARSTRHTTPFPSRCFTRSLINHSTHCRSISCQAQTVNLPNLLQS